MDLPIKFGGIACCDQLCKVCERLFRGRGPRDGKSLKRLHHSMQRLQASAKSGCHLCNLIIGVMDKGVVKELNEEITAASGSYNRCLCVSVELGEYPRLKIFGSRVFERGFRPLSYDALSLEPGEDYCLNRIIYIPSFNCDIHVPDSTPQPGRAFVPRVRSTDTVHDICLGLIRKWVQDCRRCHPLCRQSLVPDQKHLPRRLLEIGLHDTGDILVRVRQTKDLPQAPQYVTLSHRWRDEPARLLEGNQSCYETDIPLKDLSKHFNEAIRLCWSLGYEYIWIDSLCIVQDSDDDWAHEAGRMCYIYANSTLTFAATAASESDCGLNCNRNYLEVAPCRIQASWANEERYNLVCYETGGWQRHVEGPDLHDRGWVVQERLLSPRTIHFAADQVYWECASLRASEFLPYGPIPEQPDYVAQQNLKCLLRRDQRGKGEAMSFDYTWTEILRLYTRTELTHESDRIVALSGIVTALNEVFNLDYSDFVMGLWKSRLPHQLLWYTEGVDFDDQAVLDGAPSWSWLSYRGGVEYDDIFWSGEPLVSVLKVDEISLHLQGFLCAMSELLNFVEVDNGTIPIKGDVKPWKHKLFRLIEWSVSSSGLSEEELTEALFFCPVFTVLDDLGRIPEDHVYGLVLRPTGKEKGQYQRVGSLNLGCLDERSCSFRMPNNYSTSKLNESLFLDLDNSKGYTIAII